MKIVRVSPCGGQWSPQYTQEQHHGTAITKYKGNGLNLMEGTDDISKEQTWNETGKYIWKEPQILRNSSSELILHINRAKLFSQNKKTKQHLAFYVKIIFTMIHS